jgi:hypothetical protein
MVCITGYPVRGIYSTIAIIIVCSFMRLIKITPVVPTGKVTLIPEVNAFIVSIPVIIDEIVVIQAIAVA